MAFQPVFDEEDFMHGGQIRIGFKTSEQTNPNEHWMNKLSVTATRHRSDVEPGGTLCHAEIMIQVQYGDWRRWSIAKKTRIRNEDGVSAWLPGKVHCKTVDMLHDDYIFVSVTMSRKNQKVMFQFLQSQVGGGFNTFGYWVNFAFFCCCAVGTREYSTALHRMRRTWYCTELISTALQAGKLKGFSNVVPCQMSPNALYRLLCSHAHALPGTHPGKSIVIDL
jgi:hypothetical protein